MREVFTLRASETEKDRWRAAADGIPVSTWLRRIANEECARLEAERRQAKYEQEERRKLKDAIKGYY